MADPTKTVAPKAATSTLVSITVAPGRTITHAVKVGDEVVSKDFGPGAVLDVEPAEAKRLRRLGFALPEPEAAKPDEKAEG